MPVEAASSAPRSVTEAPSPPRRLPNSAPMVRRSSSAMRARSRIRPMKTKSGIAISDSAFIVLNTRVGSAPIRLKFSAPAAQPIRAKITAVPARTKAMGAPLSTRTQSPANIRRSRGSVSMSVGLSGRLEDVHPLAAQDRDAAQRDGDRLYRQERGEGEDDGLEQVGVGHSAEEERALADRPGRRDVGPGEPAQDRAERQDAEHDAEQDDERPAAGAHVGVAHVLLHMA